MNFLFFKLFLVQLQVFPFPKRLFSTVDDLVISPKWPNPTYIEYAKETHPLTVLLGQHGLPCNNHHESTIRELIQIATYQF